MMLFMLLAFTGSIVSVYSQTNRIVCYYESWAPYRNGDGKFEIKDINPKLCTHLIYAFVGLNDDFTIKILDKWQAVDLGGYDNFNNLRNKNSNLKTLIAVGGANEDSAKYSTMVSSANNRKTFIQSAINFIEKYKFNGLDLDWEYPGKNGKSSDKENFTKLVQEMRKEFDKRGYLLSAAVAAWSSQVDKSYNVPALSQNLDFINVMTYDLHGSWQSVTGQNSPLYPSSSDVTDFDKSLTVDASISFWIQKGASPSKLNLGVGAYGRSFTLRNSGDTKVGAPTTGGGSPGKYTGEEGYLGYNEICENLNSGWTEVWDNQQKVPYAYKGNQWVGYDNPKSVGIKVDYAKSRGLGGIMVWALDTDDFRGICGKVNPLLNRIKYRLNN